MFFWNVALGFLAGVGITMLAGWGILFYKRRFGNGEAEKEKIDISLQDIIGLAALNTTMDVTALIIEYKINLKMPEFFEKYQALNKQEKELYFNELIGILGKNRREDARGLLDKYPGFTNQDVLLLLMSEMQVDNKTMARIMGLTSDTLKKRKTRLRTKMQSGQNDE